MKFKRVELKGYNDEGKAIVYDLELRGNVTIVKGDSGTGKTLMCQVVKQMISYGDKDKIVFDDKNVSSVSVAVLQTYKNKLILFDDADITLRGELLKYVLSDKNNYYILFRRDNYDVHLSPNYYAEIVLGNDRVRRLKYTWEKVGWYD